MKFTLIFLAFIALNIQTYAQSKNNISVVYGISTTNVDIHDAIGDFGYNQKTGVMSGITYTRKFNKWFSVETGLLFADDKAEMTAIVPGRGNALSDGNVKIVSVPIYAKFTFLRYFYGDTGFSIDNQTNYSSSSVVNSQSGTGIELGIGAKYTIGPVTIFINPYTHIYAISNGNFNLVEVGYKFGAGYNF